MSTIARFSLTEYDRILETGALDRRNLELVRGEIRETAPIGPLHQCVVDALNRWSLENLASRARVRIRHSVGLRKLDSAPRADVIWVTPFRYMQGRPQPADVFLVIEVAEGSLDFSRSDRAALYCEAGVTDYWVVDLTDRTLTVHREPESDDYRNVTVHRDQDEVRPLAFPDAVLRPATLWE